MNCALLIYFSYRRLQSKEKLEQLIKIQVTFLVDVAGKQNNIQSAVRILRLARYAANPPISLDHSFPYLSRQCVSH